MDKYERRNIKKTAKGILKKHYGLMLIVCLVACVLGTKYTNELEILKINSTITEAEESELAAESEAGVITSFGLDGVYSAVLQNNTDAYKQAAEEKIESDKVNKDIQIGILQIGRKNGVLASVVNQVSSGTIFLTVYSAIKSMTGSNTVSTVIFVFLSLLIYLAFAFFVVDVYRVIMVRITLESRIYDKVPTGRFVYLIRIKKWFKVGLALIRWTIYELLWSLTIVGGLIKTQSYFCVPYILAENPDLTGKDAILLSRKMMDGHKWELFKFKLSFILWELLSSLTFELLGALFVNPYMACAEAEYYTRLRNRYKADGMEMSDLLNDRYLFEKADPEILKRTYADVAILRELPEEKFEGGHKFEKFLAVNFGIILRHTEEEKKYLRSMSIKKRIEVSTQIMDGEIYPNRLSPIPEEDKIKSLEAMGYMRCYSIESLILIFFSAAFVGWLWECTLHLITDHKWVNRGVLHGPWLPIYGSGGLIMLILLTRFRKKPAATFGLSMILAGIVEYATAWQLETTHAGEKWWDYSGYFLNLHGRVCAEGLVVFGLGGLAIVYLVAPMLDNQFRKIPKKVIYPLCAVLLLIYAGDFLYSQKHPNKGEGITDYPKSSAVQSADPEYTEVSYVNYEECTICLPSI